MTSPSAMSASGESLPSWRPANIERLTRLSRAFTYATSLAEMLELAVRQAAEMLRVERAILLLPDDRGVLHVKASHGVSREVVERFRDSLDESLARRLHDLVGAPLVDGFFGVPLVSKGKVIGLLAVLRPDLDGITEEDEWLLSAIADQVAVPLENARRAEQLEHAALVDENVRLLESERAARMEAEAAREESEVARLRADAAREEAEAARDLALEADRSKAAFLAAMSHDLRTPLNAIAGYVELLKLGVRGPITEDQAADLDRIDKNQLYLLSIVSEILEFTKLGAGRVTYQFSNVTLESVLRDAHAMILPQITARRIRYVYEGGADGVVLRTDVAKTQQILLNVLSNAIKFTPEEGTINVMAQARSDGIFAAAPVVQVRILDSGPGIPPDKLEWVFLPFVQLTGTLSHPNQGIGLGLAISRDLARGLGGDLVAESQTGHGALFTLTLPLAPAATA